MLESWLWFANRLKYILCGLSWLWSLIVKRRYNVRRTFIQKKNCSFYWCCKVSSPLKHCRVLAILTLSQLIFYSVCEASCWHYIKDFGPTQSLLESYKLVCTSAFKLIDSLVVFTTAVTVMFCDMECFILLVKKHIYSGVYSFKLNNFKEGFFCRLWVQF